MKSGLRLIINILCPSLMGTKKSSLFWKRLKSGFGLHGYADMDMD